MARQPASAHDPGYIKATSKFSRPLSECEHLIPADPGKSI